VIFCGLHQNYDIQFLGSKEANIDKMRLSS
jgi:hypothetical protein